MSRIGYLVTNLISNVADIFIASVSVILSLLALTLVIIGAAATASIILQNQTKIIPIADVGFRCVLGAVYRTIFEPIFEAVAAVYDKVVPFYNVIPFLVRLFSAEFLTNQVVTCVGQTKSLYSLLKQALSSLKDILFKIFKWFLDGIFKSTISIYGIFKTLDPIVDILYANFSCLCALLDPLYLIVFDIIACEPLKCAFHYLINGLLSIIQQYTTWGFDLSFTIITTIFDLFINTDIFISNLLDLIIGAGENKLPTVDDAIEVFNTGVVYLAQYFNFLIQTFYCRIYDVVITGMNNTTEYRNCLQMEEIKTINFFNIFPPIVIIVTRTVNLILHLFSDYYTIFQSFTDALNTGARHATFINNNEKIPAFNRVWDTIRNPSYNGSFNFVKSYYITEYYGPNFSFNISAQSSCQSGYNIKTDSIICSECAMVANTTLEDAVLDLAFYFDKLIYKSFGIVLLPENQASYGIQPTFMKSLLHDIAFGVIKTIVEFLKFIVDGFRAIGPDFLYYLANEELYHNVMNELCGTPDSLYIIQNDGQMDRIISSSILSGFVDLFASIADPLKPIIGLVVYPLKSAFELLRQIILLVPKTVQAYSSITGTAPENYSSANLDDYICVLGSPTAFDVTTCANFTKWSQWLMTPRIRTVNMANYYINYSDPQSGITSSFMKRYLLINQTKFNQYTDFLACVQKIISLDIIVDFYPNNPTVLDILNKIPDFSCVIIYPTRIIIELLEILLKILLSIYETVSRGIQQNPQQIHILEYLACVEIQYFNQTTMNNDFNYTLCSTMPEITSDLYDLLQCPCLWGQLIRLYYVNSAILVDPITGCAPNIDDDISSGICDLLNGIITSLIEGLQSLENLFELLLRIFDCISKTGGTIVKFSECDYELYGRVVEFFDSVLGILDDLSDSFYGLGTIFGSFINTRCLSRDGPSCTPIINGELSPQICACTTRDKARDLLVSIYQTLVSILGAPLRIIAGVSVWLATPGGPDFRTDRPDSSVPLSISSIFTDAILPFIYALVGDPDAPNTDNIADDGYEGLIQKFGRFINCFIGFAGCTEDINSLRQNPNIFQTGDPDAPKACIGNAFIVVGNLLRGFLVTLVQAVSFFLDFLVGVFTRDQDKINLSIIGFFRTLLDYIIHELFSSISTLLVTVIQIVGGILNVIIPGIEPFVDFVLRVFIGILNTFIGILEFFGIDANGDGVITPFNVKKRSLNQDENSDNGEYYDPNTGYVYKYFMDKISKNHYLQIIKNGNTTAFNTYNFTDADWQRTTKIQPLLDDLKEYHQLPHSHLCYDVYEKLINSTKQPELDIQLSSMDIFILKMCRNIHLIPVIMRSVGSFYYNPHHNNDFSSFHTQESTVGKTYYHEHQHSAKKSEQRIKYHRLNKNQSPSDKFDSFIKSHQRKNDKINNHNSFHKYTTTNTTIVEEDSIIFVPEITDIFGIESGMHDVMSSTNPAYFLSPSNIVQLSKNLLEMSNYYIKNPSFSGLYDVLKIPNPNTEYSYFTSNPYTINQLSTSYDVSPLTNVLASAIAMDMTNSNKQLTNLQDQIFKRSLSIQENYPNLNQDDVQWYLEQSTLVVDTNKDYDDYIFSNSQTNLLSSTDKIGKNLLSAALSTLKHRQANNLFYMMDSLYVKGITYAYYNPRVATSTNAQQPIIKKRSFFETSPHKSSEDQLIFLQEDNNLELENEQPTVTNNPWNTSLVTDVFNNQKFLINNPKDQDKLQSTTGHDGVPYESFIIKSSSALKELQKVIRMGHDASTHIPHHIQYKNKKYNILTEQSLSKVLKNELNLKPEYVQRWIKKIKYPLKYNYYNPSSGLYYGIDKNVPSSESVKFYSISSILRARYDKRSDNFQDFSNKGGMFNSHQINNIKNPIESLRLVMNDVGTRMSIVGHVIKNHLNETYIHPLKQRFDTIRNHSQQTTHNQGHMNSFIDQIIDKFSTMDAPKTPPISKTDLYWTNPTFKFLQNLLRAYYVVQHKYSKAGFGDFIKINKRFENLVIQLTKKQLESLTSFETLKNVFNFSTIDEVLEHFNIEKTFMVPEYLVVDNDQLIADVYHINQTDNISISLSSSSYAKTPFYNPKSSKSIHLLNRDKGIYYEHSSSSLFSSAIKNRKLHNKRIDPHNLWDLIKVIYDHHFDSLNDTTYNHDIMASLSTNPKRIISNRLNNKGIYIPDYDNYRSMINDNCKTVLHDYMTTLRGSPVLSSSCRNDIHTDIKYIIMRAQGKTFETAGVCNCNCQILDNFIDMLIDVVTYPIDVVIQDIPHGNILTEEDFPIIAINYTSNTDYTKSLVGNSIILNFIYDTFFGGVNLIDTLFTFITNTNSDVSQDKVGLLYFFKRIPFFFATCDRDFDTRCQLGYGFFTGFLTALIVTFAIPFVLSYFFPPLSTLYTGIITLVAQPMAFLYIFFFVGYGYPIFSCMALIIPITPPPPLPECIVTDIYESLSAVFNFCLYNSISFMIVDSMTNMPLTATQLNILCTTCQDNLLVNPLDIYNYRILDCDTDIGFAPNFFSTISYIFRKIVPSSVSKYLLETCLNRGNCIPGIEGFGKDIITMLYNYSGVNYNNLSSINDPLNAYINPFASTLNEVNTTNLQSMRLDYCFASSFVQTLPLIYLTIVASIFSYYIIFKLIRSSTDILTTIANIPPFSIIVARLSNINNTGGSNNINGGIMTASENDNITSASTNSPTTNAKLKQTKNKKISNKKTEMANIFNKRKNE